MTKIISDEQIQNICDDLAQRFEGDRGWLERRDIAKAQRNSSDKEILHDLEAILKDAGDLRVLERQLVGYVAILNQEVKGR